MSRTESPIEILILAAVLALALLWRVLLFSAIQDTPLANWHTWDQSDMHSFMEQARRFAAGDWLGRVPHHPYHHWMRVAPWESWRPFYARPVFHQAPLYSYGLAALMRLNVDAALAARLIQLVLGVAATGLAYGLARRVFGLRAALPAGLLMAIYGPLMVVESQVLRDTLVLFLTLLIIIIYQSWERRPWLAGLKFPLALGVLLGVLAMAHEGAALLALTIFIAGFLRLRKKNSTSSLQPPASSLSSFRISHSAFRIPHSAFRIWLLPLLAGLLLGCGPLLARNLAVGAPLLPRFVGSAIAFAVANHATAGWGGASWIAPAPAFGWTLADAHGSIGALIAGVLHSYNGQWWRWLGNWAMRLGALGIGAENNENICQAYFNRHVPILAFTVDFRVLLPLAAMGAVSWGRRRWAAAFVHGRTLGVLAVHLALVALMLSLVLPLGRYRLMLLPGLLPLAGQGVAAAWTALERRRPARLAALGALGCAVVLGQWGLGRMLPFGGLRPVDYQVAAKVFMDWGRPDLAATELQNGIEAGLPREAFSLELGLAEEAMGNESGAAEQYERMLAGDPGQPLALARLGWLRAAGHDGAVRRPEDALDLARRYATPARAGTAEANDLLAAACAAGGDFAQARIRAEAALAAARERNLEALARQIEKRLVLYRQDRPYVR